MKEESWQRIPLVNKLTAPSVALSNELKADQALADSLAKINKVQVMEE